MKVTSACALEMISPRVRTYTVAAKIRQRRTLSLLLSMTLSETRSASRHRYLLISHTKSAVTAIIVVVVIVFTIRHITPALRVFDNTSLPYILNESDLHHTICFVTKKIVIERLLLAIVLK
ncbi:hypothetical protein ALC53_10060 [Atta colombica]|uniref:Uncharacterized protein n=1 Tax=Atta colombica TaxID=520822 RepID=A0A151I125_9HYME|nr:hypothetical protein ALC53_10060 [Atta colombica]